MKRIALLFTFCLMVTLTFAHDVPVPHAHQDYVHGLLPFLQFVVAPLAVAWLAFKLYKHFRQTDRA
ncbi:MAG: hypothetical protein ACFB15_14130 [Cyclobacteriaceae bacterium]